jgi:hypothetical protein
VKVRDQYGELLAQEEGPVVPQRIRPGHAGDFRISMPLPSLVSKPKVEAEVSWD